MRPITYVTGDATTPIKHPFIIAHVCNDIGKWGKGFVVTLAHRFPEAREDYLAYYSEGGALRLGETIYTYTSGKKGIIASMVAQHGIRSATNKHPLNYLALDECLSQVAIVAGKDHSIHMPRIGCGLAGGQWGKVEPIIEKNLCARDIEVIVYDYLPKNTAKMGT